MNGAKPAIVTITITFQIFINTGHYNDIIVTADQICMRNFLYIVLHIYYETTFHRLMSKDADTS